ncbi:MAG: ABC transporter permease [Ruminococcus sp.]
MYCDIDLAYSLIDPKFVLARKERRADRGQIKVMYRSMYQKAKVEASEKEHIAAPASTMLADAWIRLKKNKAAVVALFILIGIILLAIFAPIFSKYSFRDTDYNNVYGLPSAAHIFGADQFGRDLWVRTWMGTRISLMIALVAAILDLVVGVLYGAVSALFGGKVDAVIQPYY